ncbi:MAG: DUF1003 domain-containing protein [Actinobacteria bacterium]|nr:DUF1003 domain-containing protein [Actinomycetota bacterium]MCL6104532.1 DUF1003 domain-containing protein [Actinomycetota bacterium]
MNTTLANQKHNQSPIEPLFRYVPHPHIEQRKHSKPPSVEDEHVGFNGRLGASITKAVGTMWAFYIASFFMGAWMLLAEVKVITFDPYPFAFLLFLGNIVQLLLMFVIMVGQQVLGASSDKRAIQTYTDAETILHECMQLQAHLQAQDKILQNLLTDNKTEQTAQ